MPPAHQMCDVACSFVTVECDSGYGEDLSEQCDCVYGEDLREECDYLWLRHDSDHDED